MHASTHLKDVVVQNGVWGPVTATLDWCEANYQFSYYVAEMSNTFSNLFSIYLAMFGARMVYSENLPSLFLIGYLGFALVGVGSFAFHMTLLYGAQMADELPMVYVISYFVYIVLDTPSDYVANIKANKSLAGLVIAFDIIFTVTYAIYRNPIYHQSVFALLVAVLTIRGTYLLSFSEAGSRIPRATKSTIAALFWGGAITFASGFLMWNLDNIYCDTVTGWKSYIQWPAAFVLEGHSWWHILTGIGSYLACTGITYMVLCIRDIPGNYTLDYSMVLLPYVRRRELTSKESQALQMSPPWKFVRE